MRHCSIPCSYDVQPHSKISLCLVRDRATFRDHFDALRSDVVPVLAPGAQAANPLTRRVAIDTLRSQSAPKTSPDLPKRQAAEAPPPQRSAPSPRLKLTPTWANDKPQRCRPRPGAYLGCGTDKHSPRQYTPTTAGET